MTKILGNKSKGGGSSSVSSAKEDPNTLTNNTVAKAVLLISEGPVEGLATGDGKSLYFDDVPLLDSNGDENFKGVSWTFRNGLPDQDHIPGIGSASSITSVGQKVEFATPREFTVTGNYDATNVVIQIPVLTESDPTTGTLKGTDLSYKIEVKVSGGSYVTVHTVNLVRQKTTSEWRGFYRVDLPPGGSPWTVKVTRLTADSGSVNLQNDMYLFGYSTIVDGKFSYRNSSVLGVILPAKEFQGRPPTIKVKLKGIKVWVPKNYDPVTRAYATVGVGTSGGIWDGTFKAAYTNNPVWVFHDLLINNRYGLGQDFNPTDDADTALVDKWSLYNISQFCDELVPDDTGSTEPRYTCNVQITDKQEAYELLQTVVSIMNGMIYFSAEKIYTVVDKPETLDDIYTQADVEGGIFEYSGTSLKTRHSAVVSYYNDPNQLYKRAAIIYEDPDLIEQFGYRPVEINNFGCTSRAQAMRTAKWLLHTEKSQTQTVAFRTGHRGGLLTPGSIIKIFDDYKSGARQGGRILSSTGTSPNITFTLDATVTIPIGSTFIYINDDGIPVSCAIGSTLTNVTQVTVTDGDGLPVNGATFAIVKPDLDGQLYRILLVKEEETEKYAVIGLQHDETKFDIIDAEAVFDDLPTSVYAISQLPTVTAIDVTQWWEDVSGTESFPHVTVSWLRPTDSRVVNFEVQLKTINQDYTTVQIASSTSWDSPRLISTTGTDYSVRVRCIDALGRYSDWAYYAAFAISGKDTTPASPTGTSLTAIIKGYLVSWDNPTMTDFKCVEVWVGTTAVQASSTLRASISDDFFLDNTLTPGDVRYVWLRTRTHATTNNSGAFVSLGSVTAAAVTSADVDGSIDTGIPSGASLPASGMVEGDFYYLTTDDKLYRYTGTVWTAAVAASDITGTLTNSQIADLAAAKLTGQITTTQITDSAITTGKINAGAITTAKIAALAITTAELAAGAVTAAKITAGTITTNEIATNTIVANNIAAGTITAAKIAAGTITGDKIAANTITSETLQIGPRGISLSGIQFQHNTPFANAVSWNAGTLHYINDSGTPTSVSISAGADGTWSSGTLYVYWIKGDSLFNTTYTLSTAQNTDRLIIATYKGGIDLTVMYGRTLIDGSGIKTGTITADRMSVTSLSAISADVGTITAGTIRNAGNTFNIDVTNGRATTTAGSYVLYQGNGFGASSDLVMWYGASSTAIGSATKTNGKWAFATDGKVYYGATELSSMPATFTASASPTSVSHSGSAVGDTNSTTVTPSGGTAGYTYQWSLNWTDSTAAEPPYPNSPTSATTTFHGSSIDLVTGSQASFSCLVTDSTGRVTNVTVIASFDP